jgi:cytoskeletal protein CcmA (bactofilin family)
MSLSEADISANWTQVAANEIAITNATASLNAQRSELSLKRQQEVALVALIRSARLSSEPLVDEDDKWQEIAQLRVDQATIRETLNTLRNQIRAWQLDNEERQELLQQNALLGVELPTFPTLPAGTLALPPLYVAGRLDVAGDLAVENDASVTEDLSAAAVSASGAVRAAATLDVSGAATFGAGVSIVGDLTVSGTQTILNSQTLEVEDALIVVNRGLSAAPPSTLKSGLEVNRGTEQPYQFVFVEESGTFRVGVSGELQAVATREDAPVSAGFPVWNAALDRFDTSGSRLALASEGSRIAALAPLDVSGDLRVAYNLDVSGTAAFDGTLTLPGGALWSAEYAAGAVYSGEVDPSGATRLNFDGVLHVAGLTSMGNVTAFSTATTSDARLKTEVVDLAEELDASVVLSAMRPVAYTDRTGQRRVGFIAQEIRELVPQVVNEDPATGLLSVAYGDLVAVLAAAVQQLAARPACVCAHPCPCEQQQQQ